MTGGFGQKDETKRIGFLAAFLLMAYSGPADADRLVSEPRRSAVIDGEMLVQAQNGVSDFRLLKGAIRTNPRHWCLSLSTCFTWTGAPDILNPLACQNDLPVEPPH